MKPRLLLIIVWFVSITATAQTIEIPDSLLHVKYQAGLHYYPGLGVIPQSELPEGWQLDTEAIYQAVAEHELVDIYADLNYFYSNYIVNLDRIQKQEELKRMKEAARRYKSRKLEQESVFLDAYLLDNIHEDRQKMIDHTLRILRETERKGDHILAVRIKYSLQAKLFYLGEDYYRIAFRLAEELLNDLEKVTEEEFPEKRYAYSEIGNLFYFFRDYDRAIPILEKSLTDHVRYYFDRSNLRTRNTLAVCYTIMGDTAKALDYYHSMLTNRDQVWHRAMFDAIALSNLGGIYMRQGRHDEAIRLFQAAIPVAIAEKDYSFAAGGLIGMGGSYLALGEMEKVKQVIDSVRGYMADPSYSVSVHRNRILFPLMSKYYLRSGDIEKSEIYADSAVWAEKKYEEEFNTRLLLKTRQELYESEKAIRDEKISSQRRQIFLGGVIIGLLLLVVVGLVHYQRRLHAKNFQLVQRLREQDALRIEKKNIPPPTEESAEAQLFRKLEEYLLTSGVYRRKVIDRKMIVSQLYTNETYLFAAVRTATGMSLLEYIHTLRLDYARELLRDRPEATIEQVAEESGFNTSRTFYRQFREHYGITPAEYRKHINH